VSVDDDGQTGVVVLSGGQYVEHGSVRWDFDLLIKAVVGDGHWSVTAIFDAEATVVARGCR
jgi:hypothetical protein